MGQLAIYESTREKELRADRLHVHGVREGKEISTVAITAENTGKMSATCGHLSFMGRTVVLSRLQLCFHIETMS